MRDRAKAVIEAAPPRPRKLDRSTFALLAGLAVDKAFPLRALLATADVFAEQPLGDGEDLAWTAEAGVRYQLSPQFNIDLGVGRRFTGDDQGWFFTFGTARAFGLRGLISR